MTQIKHKQTLALIAILISLQLTFSEYAEALPFRDHSAGSGHSGELPFRNESATIYGATHLDASNIASSLQALSAVINQRMGQLPEESNHSLVENASTNGARRQALLAARGNLLSTMSSGATNIEQVDMYVARTIEAFAREMQRRTYSLSRTLHDTAQAKASYAYAEEMLFVLHRICLQIQVGVHWHLHSAMLSETLSHLQTLNSNYLHNAMAIGLEIKALSDLDGALRYYTLTVQEHGIGAHVFRTLRSLTRQVINAGSLTIDHLKKGAIRYDTYPPAPHSYDLPKYLNNYDGKVSTPSMTGATGLPFR